MEQLIVRSKAPLSGIILLCGTTLVISAALAEVFHILEYFVYVVILFPILMGVALGWAINWAIKNGKIRMLSLVATVVLLGALLTFGLMRYFDYLGARADATSYLVQEYQITYGKPPTEDELTKLVDTYFVTETGNAGFIGFMLLAAKNEGGYSAARLGALVSPLTFRGALVWGNWALDIILMAAVGIYMTAKTARQRFCENCDKWFPGDKTIGVISTEQYTDASDLLQSNRFTEFGKGLKAEASGSLVEFHLNTCNTCKTGKGYLSGTAFLQDANGKVTKRKVLDMELSKFNRAALEQGLAQAEQSENVGS